MARLFISFDIDTEVNPEYVRDAADKFRNEVTQLDRKIKEAKAHDLRKQVIATAERAVGETAPSEPFLKAVGSRLAGDSPENCSDMLKRLGTDAAAWAREMDKRGFLRVDATIGSNFHGWLCNLIEISRDKGRPEVVSAKNSILQDWVMRLGLRHQGVLLTAVRGPDNMPKECVIKVLVRAYRATILKCFCGDPTKSSTFIEDISPKVLKGLMSAVVRDHDALPHHYLMHLIHAAQIVGYCNAEDPRCMLWSNFYADMCNKFHMVTETPAQMNDRLNASDSDFAKAQ